MTFALATTYKNTHAAAIIADLRAKRQAARDELPGKSVPYPRHVQTKAGEKTVRRGNAPEWVYEKREILMDAVTRPAMAGVTVTIDQTDFTGGRDENGQRVEDGHGAVINITTADGTLKVHEGYHRGGSSDKWEGTA